MYLIDPDAVVRMNRRSLVDNEIHGLRNGSPATLEAALGRPLASYDGVPLFAGVANRAGALLHALAFSHPFVDGNKRTAIMATGFYLDFNNMWLGVTREQAAHFVVEVIAQRGSVEDVTRWVMTHLHWEHEKRPSL